ncbi:MAG: sugar ABC transporter permease [Actinomycetota bacterium]|nr:sugar ABC transporter permease [Actinomycetota bacterium]
MTRGRPLLTGRQREAGAAYAFLSPWVIGFVALTLVPMIGTLALSFSNYDLLDPGRTGWVGAANYREAASDPTVRQALKVTAYYALAEVGLNLVLGLALALLLNSALRGIATLRTIYYLPAVVSGVAVAILWLWIFQPSSGLANRLLNLVGLPSVGWVYSSTWVIPAFVLMGLWGVGQNAFIYLAVLQRIPTNLYEAAAVDGVGPLRRLARITLPLVTPAIFVNLVLGLIGNFQIFTAGFVITSGKGGPGSLTLGGPGQSSLFYVLYLYQNAFSRFRFGYASALAWILFVLLLAMTLLIFRTSRRWVYEEGRRFD